MGESELETLKLSSFGRHLTTFQSNNFVSVLKYYGQVDCVDLVQFITFSVLGTIITSFSYTSHCYHTDCDMEHSSIISA